MTAEDQRVEVAARRAVAEQLTPELIAQGLELALHRLAEGDAPTLKRVVMSILTIFGDGANRWIGSKLLALAGASVVGFLLWLAARKW